LKKNAVKIRYVYDTLQPGQVLSSSHFKSPGTATYAHPPEILAEKDRTICREVCPVILHK